MRVVTGSAKGRKLKGPKTSGTRPIIDRVKTALFDILSWRVQDVRFLDLFAGTGGVGIEALSRGAAQATFIDMSLPIVKLVRENLQITELSTQAEVLHMDSFKFLQNHAEGTGLSHPPILLDEFIGGHPRSSGKEPRPLQSRFSQNGNALAEGNGKSTPPAARQYDMIYVAPPQYHEMAAKALGMLDTSPLLATGGLVIVQVHPKERPGVVAVPLTRLVQTDERRYGSTLLLFYKERQLEEETPTHGDPTAIS